MYKMEKKVKWYNRINGEFYFIPLANIILLIRQYDFLVNYLLIIELFIISLTILLLFRKNCRLIYKIEFYDDKNIILISFYQFIQIKSSYTIPYSMVNYQFKYKRYGIGIVRRALSFYISKKYIAEIREKNKLGWTKEELAIIMDKINLIIKSNEKIH